MYRRDVATGELVLVSRANGAGGEPIGLGASSPAISADGNRVVFLTPAALDPADGDNENDAYLRDIAAGTTVLVSRADGPGGAGADDAVVGPIISADGNRVAFGSAAGNLGVPASTVEHLYLRDIAAAKTHLVDVASAPSANIGDDDVSDWSLSGDGSRVVFTTFAKNLHPDDPTPGMDVYLRDLPTSTTMLLSRRPGLAGAPLGPYSNGPAISRDGRYVAFSAGDEQAVPGSGPWAGRQVIRREIESGKNELVSHNAAGGAANRSVDRASISADGSRVSFVTYADNLLPGLGGEVRSAAFVRDFGSGGLSGPPAFGLVDNHQGVYSAELSDDGRCLAVYARGHNASTGPAGDWHSLYMYVVEGDCHRPEPVARSVAKPTPRLSRVSVRPRRFAVAKRRTARVSAAKAKRGAKKRGSGKQRRVKRGTVIRFRLNTRATVRIGFQRRGVGLRVRVGRKARRAGVKGRFRCRNAPARVIRRVKRARRCALWRPVGAIVRGNRAAGRIHKVRFSGRIGRRALKPGRYRAVLRARNDVGASKPVRRPFRIVRR